MTIQMQKTLAYFRLQAPVSVTQTTHTGFPLEVRADHR